MSKTSLDNIALRSEEVQEILTKVPNWMIRWGSIVFLILLVMLLIISWFVKYPDAVQAQVIITTQIPLQKEYAKINAKIEAILVEDGQAVSTNESLAILTNTANYKDVYRLKSVIDATNLNSDSLYAPIEDLSTLSLGSITPQYTLFKKNYLQYRLNQGQKEKRLFKNTIESINKLKKSIKDWEQLYVLKSGIKGNISFLNYWNTNQEVKKETEVFIIIPSGNPYFIAKLRTRAEYSGKIKMGQKVNIRLQNYPDTEFGVLMGKVKRVSLLPDKYGYCFVDVDLTKKHITSFNKEIHLNQEMRGQAEIITEDLRLIDRFFYQFKEIGKQK